MKSRIHIGGLVLGAALVLFGNGCDGGREGDRCNPNLSHNDCNDGLSCVQPSTCVENYCCPTNGSSSDPYCNGSACPPADAAADTGSSDDGAADSATGDTGAVDGGGG